MTRAGRGPEVLQFQLRKRAQRLDVRPHFTQAGDNVIIASTVRLDAHRRRQGRYQVLTLCGGKIVDIQGRATRRQAERFARRRTT